MLLSSQSQLQEVEAENSQLQLHLKELNEEYRSRLVQYIKDVAVGTPSPRGSPCRGSLSVLAALFLQAVSPPCWLWGLRSQCLQLEGGSVPLSWPEGGDSSPCLSIPLVSCKQVLARASVLGEG